MATLPPEALAKGGALGVWSRDLDNQKALKPPREWPNGLSRGEGI